jgi:Mo-co oxidoreductase dimerisation domain
VPQPDQELRAGAPLRLRGVAFGGNRGVSRVEVSTGGGRRWSEARIDYPGTPLSWALWSLEWSPPAPGTYALVVHATDGSGEPQVATERDTAPQGATGYHRVTVRVR